MVIDVSLCCEYLGVTEDHWTQALAALEFANRDPLAKALAQSVLGSLGCGDRENAVESARAAKEYYKNAAPELVEGVYPMLIALALPQTLANFRAAGESEEIIRDTVCDYGTWVRSYFQQTGKVGFGEIGWECNFHSGWIVKLGRIQFERSSFHAPYTVYRHRASGALIVAPNPGVAVNADGFLAIDEPAAFTTEFVRENGALRFNGIDYAAARILPEKVEYAADDLEPLMTTGMHIINMHIPEVGPLSVDEVGRSLEMAKEYFAAKGYPCTVAMCESWLLDPALETYGAHSPNILSFQRRFTKFPWPSTHSDAVNRVFGRGTDTSDLDALPENSRLQKGLKAFLKTGAPLRDAGGMLVL